MDYDGFSDAEPEERPRDEKIDEVKNVIVPRIFDPNPKRVFYSVQVETLLEREYFHWITNKALAELAAEGALQRTEQLILPMHQRVFFYSHPRHRYWKRDAKALAKLLSEIYDPDFTQAIGSHAELLFDSALARIGFRPIAKNVNTWEGKSWLTQHNLDRIAIAGGIAYGIEIKNTQNYISHEELKTKIQLCKHLGLTPLFIMRFAPKSYVDEVWRNGGFTLLYEDQLCPFGHRKFMQRVRERLGLKVQCPRDIPEGHLQRLKNWHDKRKAKS